MAAARLLEDTLVLAFFESERKRLVEQMISASIADDETRRNAAVELQAIRNLQTHLQTEAALGRKQQEKAKTHG